VGFYDSTLPRLKLIVALAANHDPMPKLWVYIVENGKTPWLQGTLGEGSAEEVAAHEIECLRDSRRFQF
jgi:hypothetical protein